MRKFIFVGSFTIIVICLVLFFSGCRNCPSDNDIKTEIKKFNKEKGFQIPDIAIFDKQQDENGWLVTAKISYVLVKPMLGIQKGQKGIADMSYLFIEKDNKWIIRHASVGR